MPRAQLRIRRRYLQWHAILPTLRSLTTLGLVVSLLFGTWHWLTKPDTAGALEFTPHVVGAKTSAVGVQGMAIADIDSDGDQDIITAGLDGVKIYKNEANYSFTVNIIDDKQAERVQVINLDDEAKKDILVTYKGGSPSVRWFKNNGDLNFTTNTIATAGSDAVAYAGDINGDGAADIIIVSQNADKKTLRRWMNNGSGIFTATEIDPDSGVTSIVVANVFANGYNDIVTGGSKGLQRYSLVSDVYTRVDIDESHPNRTHLAVGDSPDGRTFIFSADHQTDEVAVYRTASLGRTLIKSAVDAKTVAPADIDEDGDLDVLVASQDNNKVLLYDNDGKDVFAEFTVATSLKSVYGVAVGDLDNDGDLDFVTANNVDGTIYAFERTRAKPKATKPDSILQSTSSAGLITFTTKLSDADRDPTRLRVQYSLDGDHWYKPWLTKVTVDKGSVDLKNSNGWQIGTSNPIDTNINDEVTLNITWDTKSIENTGGPIRGDNSGVKVRVIPRDDRQQGDVQYSSSFRVDNAAPTGLSSLTITAIDESQATLSWIPAVDSNSFVYKLYYGTDNTAVLEQRSAVWDGTDDASLNDVETSSSTISDIESGKKYTFKLVAIDQFGNSVAAPSTQGVASSTFAASPTPGAQPVVLQTPTPSLDTLTISPEPFTTPTFSPDAAATPTLLATPSPIGPPTLLNNQAPVADAGPDQVVNSRALVVLDGTPSYDPDQGETSKLAYSWRQLDGPLVKLLSERTATPSFSAGEASDTYIFSLTVRDVKGASTIDTVTIAIQESTALASPIPVDVAKTTAESPKSEPAVVKSALTRNILQPTNLILFGLALLSTILLLLERVGRAVRDRLFKPGVASSIPDTDSQGQVVHYQTGDPIAGAQVLIYGADGKLRSRERTTMQGVFPTFFPAGEYSLTVQATGFTFAPAASRVLAPANSILYSGGTLSVKNPDKPLSIVIPMKPTATEISTLNIRLLHIWQSTQRWGRALSWPLFLAGATLNTLLVFLAPELIYLILEILYIILVILKIALEIRVRPAYGQVRDAITHIPLDLAVVRLFDQKTNRLVMTRVTNTQGKFFALPAAATYRVTISKPGYATFSKENVEIKSEHDTTLQMTADLMPVAPRPATGGLQAARAATV